MRHRPVHVVRIDDMLQFLRELHFIEALLSDQAFIKALGCSSSGNCTSLRLPAHDPPASAGVLQFLRELHFIEASRTRECACATSRLQFLRELHFIEARSQWTRRMGP